MQRVGARDTFALRPHVSTERIGIDARSAWGVVEALPSLCTASMGLNRVPCNRGNPYEERPQTASAECRVGSKECRAFNDSSAPLTAHALLYTGR